MFRKPLLNLFGVLLLLVIGGVIGFTTQRLWVPPRAFLATPAQAQTGSITAPAPVISGTPKQQTPVMKVVQAVSPSVVTVGAEKRRVIAQPWWDDFFFPSVRYYEQRSRMPYLGSGFLVDTEGYIVTNFHVIEDSHAIFVTFPDGREFPAKLVDADRFIDVALLKIEAGNEALPPPIVLGSSGELQIGEEALAFGNPFGNMIEDSQPTLTVGFISALKRSFRPDHQHQRVYQDMIQTDAAINPGNSGGPLVDINGAAVGVNTFIFSPSGGSAGIGFAIPIDRVKSFLNEVKTYGRLRPLLLDLRYQTVRSQNPPVTGVQIMAMIPEGPAEKAGLRVGDVLIQAQGRDIASQEDFSLLFASKQVGDEVKLVVWREGETFETVYEIEEAQQ